jgi:exosortase
MNLFRSMRPGAAACAATLGVTFLWSYWPTLTGLRQEWASDPQYSHGYLVPVFALWLLWNRRGTAAGQAFRPSWLGALVLALAVLMRAAAGYYYAFWPERLSLLVALAGLALAAGGSAALRWAWPSVLFLAFMLPIPGSLLTGPMQRVATAGSVAALQTLGFPAVADGNVILLSHSDLGVVEACSGLRMLIVFFALSTAVAVVYPQAAWRRALVLLAAVPIALACNILRITATGVAHETVGAEAANFIYHDVAGWLMIVVGMALLWAEVRLLGWLSAARERPTAPAFELPGFGPVRAGPARRPAHARTA